LWEKETTPQMTSIFASNGPQPFTSSTHQRLTFGQHFFWDITHLHHWAIHPTLSPPPYPKHPQHLPLVSTPLSLPHLQAHPTKQN
jgi:hypothetical protein